LPTINTVSFPDTGKMVVDIHAKGLKAGWYLNGCKCGERIEKTINYEGDIKDLHAFDFDGVKIDGCGRQRNQTFYAELMKESGRNYTIENCHWGDCTDSDDSSCPTEEWCPFNWYRTSGDINAGSESWISNLQTTIKFQDWERPLSVPGCWAYPDMLEVGRVSEPAPNTSYSWNRAHFGAWCVVSAPLILGMELTDAELSPVMDIIGNQEAIAVNQAWAGHPGLLVANIVAPPVPYNPAGAAIPSSSPGDFDLENGASMTASRGDNATTGHASIRTGGPGQVSLIRIGTGLTGNGHKLASVSMSFRYVAGYTPAAGQTKRAATVRVVLLELATDKEVHTIMSTGPLGAYSYDEFKGYSPLVPVAASRLELPDDKVLVLALEVTNNDRNLQIPVDDRAAGFNIKITWEPTRSAALQPLLALPSHLQGFSSVFAAGQLWAKPQPGGAMAALLINHSEKPLDAYTVPFAKLNLTAASYHVRDIWERKDLGSTKQLSFKVKPYDSAFVMLTPSA